VIEREAAGTTGVERLALLRVQSLPTNDRAATPTAALLHPLWLASLAVLVLNDHVLKGSGLLPGVVTGKLSDFAGLVVAPVLLAALLRVRSRAGFTAAHVAVGLVFAAIQISAPVAAAMEGLMGALGVPWVITMDPTDLAALPVLLLGHRVLRPESAARSAMAPRTALELGAGGVGLLACVATSRVEPEPFRPEIFTDVYVHNSGDTDLVVRIRRLAPSVDIDCALVAEDPGRLLSESLFGPATTWTVPPGVNHGLYGNNEWDEGFESDDGRECRVVLFDADDMAPAIVFWRVGDPPMHSVPGEDFDPADRGGIELVFDEDGNGRFLGGEGLVFAPVAEPPLTGTCAPQPDGERLAWSEPVPVGEWTVAAMELGFDGCWSIDLSGAGSERWYVCAPIDELPFATDDTVRIEPRLDGAAGDGFAGVLVERIGVSELEATEVTAQLYLTRGAVVPAMGDLQFAAVPEFECGFVTETSCGTAARASSLTVGGPGWSAGTLRPGEGAVHLQHSGGSTADVWLTHAQDRIVLDPECAQGPDTLGSDVEVVAVWRAAP
jgi:hypothetical protein